LRTTTNAVLLPLSSYAALPDVVPPSVAARRCQSAESGRLAMLSMALNRSLRGAGGHTWPKDDHEHPRAPVGGSAMHRRGSSTSGATPGRWSLLHFDEHKKRVSQPRSAQTGIHNAASSTTADSDPQHQVPADSVNTCTAKRRVIRCSDDRSEMPICPRSRVVAGS
jgi:hypothetical protein